MKAEFYKKRNTQLVEGSREKFSQSTILQIEDPTNCITPELLGITDK